MSEVTRLPVWPFQLSRLLSFGASMEMLASNMENPLELEVFNGTISSKHEDFPLC
jgi:hypothetical protein